MGKDVRVYRLFWDYKSTMVGRTLNFPTSQNIKLIICITPGQFFAKYYFLFWKNTIFKPMRMHTNKYMNCVFCLAFVIDRYSEELFIECRLSIRNQSNYNYSAQHINKLPSGLLEKTWPTKLPPCWLTHRRFYLSEVVVISDAIFISALSMLDLP